MDDIEGIGPVRRKALMRHFGEIQKIAAASVEELEAVDGMSAAAALSVWKFFHENIVKSSDL